MGSYVRDSAGDALVSWHSGYLRLAAIFLLLSAQQPAHGQETIPVPGRASTQAVAALLVAARCDYCIEASSIGVRAASGPPIALNGMMLRREQGLKYSTYAYGGEAVLNPQNFQPGSDWLPSALPVQPEYSLYGTAVSGGCCGRYIYVPGVVVREPNRSWAAVLRTGSVCLGAQFELPSVYLRDAKDGILSNVNPVSPFPVTVSQELASLPSRPTQTICEGRLIPMDKALAMVVEDQTAVALKSLKDAADPTAIKAMVDSAVSAWLTENKDDIIGRAARIGQGAPPSGK